MENSVLYAEGSLGLTTGSVTASDVARILAVKKSAARFNKKHGAQRIPTTSKVGMTT